MERIAAERTMDIEAASVEEKMALWEDAKAALRST
jgi:hypothetical protein